MIEAHQGLIRGIVFKMAAATTARADLEDIVQSVNLRLLESGLAQYDPERGSIEAYITVMAKSMTIDAWRRAQRRPVAASLALDVSERGGRQEGDGDGYAMLYVAANSLEDQSDDTLTMLLHEEQRDRLEGVLKQLPRDDQHFLLISLKDDFDSKAYAARLGITEVALRVRKHRIAERIRALVAAAQE